MVLYVSVLPAILLFTVTLAQNVPLRGPPQFETNPQYLDSYIPASMQIIAYLTEMMKYDIKPSIPPTTTTPRPTTITTRRPTLITHRPVTTKRPLPTAPPTPYHKPALYAPYHPPGFITRYQSPFDSDVGSYEDYVKRLKNPLADYFDRYRYVDAISSIIDQLRRQRRATPFNYTPSTSKAAIGSTEGSARAGTNTLRRLTRAQPFEPKKTNTNVVVQQSGQRFTSNQGRRTQPQANRPELGRSRSIRSVVEEETSSSGANPQSETVGGYKAPFEMTLSSASASETNKSKARALLINGDNFNVRSVDYLGFGLNELIKELQSERESTENRLTDDDRVKVFSTKYDDVNFGSYLLRQKKIPPTKAYVTLLSLYDLLNKESKKLMLNKYNGYSSAIVEELIETSTGTSSEQLKIVLQRIVDRPDTYDATIRSKIVSLVTDLSMSNSYINDALRYIPPLPFSR